MGLAGALRAGASGPRLLPWLLLALGWFATIQVRPLLDPDEGRYAEIPREMLVSGDWITPRFDDLKYFEKPPLQYWGTAAAYRLFGVSEWTSRLWTFSFAFACLPLTYLWTSRLYGRVSALTALTALALSPYFVIIGHLNLLDAAFTFWLTAAVLSFTLAQTAPAGSTPERRWMHLAWAAAALAVLSKGIVVGVLAGGALIVYSLSTRDATPWRRLHAGTGAPLFVAIAAPWFVAVSLRNPGFPSFFFVHEHFTRFLSTVHQRVEPWWYFLPLLLAAVLPWVVALTRALAGEWRAGSAPAMIPHADAGVTAPAVKPFRPLAFLAVYATVTLVFFSASGSKLAPYILPMIPALAALTGARTGAAREVARHGARTGAAFAVLAAAGLLIYSARRNSFVPHEAVGWAVAATLVALTSAAVSVMRRADELATVLAAALGASLAWQCLMCEYTVIPPTRSAYELVLAVKPFVNAQTPLYSVGQYRETVSPYLGRTLQLVGYEGELHFGLTEEPQRHMSEAQFAARWSAGSSGVAFFDPGVWDSWRRRGLPGRVIAADNYTVAVSRS
jgi:4-amino-4-deoxy-L-arabinose transferase-like glycosyltransferase